MRSYSYLDMKSVREGIEKAPQRAFGVFVVKRLPCEKDAEYEERCEVLEDLKFLLAAPDMKTVRKGRKMADGKIRKMTIDRQIACLSALPDFFDDIQEVPEMATNDMPKALREAKSRGVKKLLF